MEKKFVASKAFLINPQGKLLLLRHTSGPERMHCVGKWDVPGGRMEQGEHPLETLQREVFEETGMNINAAQARPFHVDIWGVGGDVENHPIVGTFYLVLIGEEAVRLSPEHDHFVWHDPRQSILGEASPIVQRALDAYRRVEGIVVATDETVKGREGFGMIQLFTGNGKGKTTAALGEALRAHAIGKNVAFVYFDKGGTTHYSERKMLDQLGIRYVATGRDRIDAKTGRFDFSIQEIDRKEALRGLQETKRLFAQEYDVIVLDEINSTLALGMLDEINVLELMDQKPDRTELILTGRNATDAVVKKAHLVTEMRLRKHYFYSGVAAREGLDY